jgi:hypothetical protein
MPGRGQRSGSDCSGAGVRGRKHKRGFPRGTFPGASLARNCILPGAMALCSAAAPGRIQRTVQRKRSERGESEPYNPSASSSAGSWSLGPLTLRTIRSPVSAAYPASGPRGAVR